MERRPSRSSRTISTGWAYEHGGFAPTHLPYAGSPVCNVGAVECTPGEVAPVIFLPLVGR